MVVEYLKNPPSVDAEYSPNALKQHVIDSFVAYGMIFPDRVPSDLVSHRISPIPQVRRTIYIYRTFDLGRSVTNKPSCFTNHLIVASAFGDLMAKMQENVLTNKSPLIQL